MTPCTFHAPSFLIGPFRISPHPDAPDFSTPDTAAVALSRALDALSGNILTASPVIMDLVRQLCLVSLWAFINIMLKPCGAYEALDDALAIDQCNFRQDDCCLSPGSTAATFMPRGFSKTRVNTTGGASWELTRNPNLSIVIVNAIFDKSLEFLHQLQANICDNYMIHWFFPELVEGKTGTRTDKVLILPNRTIASVEPSARCLGLTGAAEGGHYDLIEMDDLVGLDAVDGQRQSGAVMEMAKKWFRTNQNALRKTRASRIVLAATRYAVDDCYEDVYASCRSVHGWTNGDLQPSPSGTWDIYYRLVEENGLYLRPEVMDKVSLEKLIRDDYWSAMTQYYNSPTKTGLAEFTEAEVRLCELLWDDEEKEYWIRKDSGNWDIEAQDVRLGSCDILMTTDLAATETGVKAKTCRSSIAVWAMDSESNRYRIWSRVGYFNIFQVFDYLFEGHRTFPGLIRGTVIEMNAFQKIIKPLVRREEETRFESIRVIPVNAAGDKKARIRTAWGPALVRHQVFATLEAGKPVLEELRVFPMSDTRLDVLDESEKAFVYLVRPATQEERSRRAYEEDERSRYGETNCIGY